MALLGNKIMCTVCGNNYHPVINSGVQSDCPVCLQATNDQAAKEHFKKLDAMPLEERIRKIEEWIYNYTPPANPYDMRY